MTPRTWPHLVRRWWGSLTGAPPRAADAAWAESFLLPGELELWRRLSNPDRRHAVAVARRFAERRGSALREEMAGALLHDVGKIESGLGTTARVVATVVGPRGRRFRQYHDHERIGADLLAACGSDALTVAMVAMSPDLPPDLMNDLSAADDL